MSQKACFICDGETLNEFRMLVVQKYGRLYGVLHKEFTIALQRRIKELKEEIQKKEALLKLESRRYGKEA